MAQMDHKEAVRLQAAEKYVLGEFPPNLRDEYEEHFFDCAECAVDVKAIAAFVDVSREVLRAETEKLAEKKAAPAQGGWLSWFRPVVAVPAFAALLLIIAYQNTVTIPQARNTSARAVAEVYGQSFLLQPSDTRRGNEATVNEAPLEVRPTEGFLLQLDFNPTATFPAYLCQLQDSSGRVLRQFAVPAEKVKQELHLPLPAGLISRSGQYSLVFFGADPVSGKAVNDSRVQYFTFNVAFRR